MPLIVEDGSMPQGANSYASVNDCDAWHSVRASAAWPAAPVQGRDANLEAKIAALIASTDYLNGIGFVGKRTKAGRIMAWPRMEAVDGDGYVISAVSIPEAVKAACCYLAGLTYGGGTDLQPVLERGGRVASSGIGELSKSYFSDAAGRDVYSGLCDILRGLSPELEAYAGTAGVGNKTQTKVIKAVLG